jgi:hypothetical protein
MHVIKANIVVFFILNLASCFYSYYIINIFDMVISNFLFNFMLSILLIYTLRKTYTIKDYVEDHIVEIRIVNSFYNYLFFILLAIYY